MATLKQIFKNICDLSNVCDERLSCGEYVMEAVGECVMEAVGEWLQQKKTTMPHLNHYCLDELLEELEHE